LYFRLPANLLVTWPEGDIVKPNEKRPAGKTVGMVDHIVIQLILDARSHFYTPAFKNVGVLCYTAGVRLSVRPSVPLTLSLQLLLNPLRDFDEIGTKKDHIV
jgi:hypothetical protein